MNDPHLCGPALFVGAVAPALAGLPWLAIAPPPPFLAVGALLSLDGLRHGRDDVPGSMR